MLYYHTYIPYTIDFGIGNGLYRAMKNQKEDDCVGVKRRPIDVRRVSIFNTDYNRAYFEVLLTLKKTKMEAGRRWLYRKNNKQRVG